MKRLYYLLIVLLLLVAGSAFYWYEYRPVRIKKECYKKANDYKNSINSTYNGLLQDGIKTTEPNLDKFLNSEYEKCLMEEGIK